MKENEENEEKKVNLIIDLRVENKSQEDKDI